MPKKERFEDPTFDAAFDATGVPADPGLDAPLSAIGAVIQKHEARLFAIPGVKSVGEGSGPVGDPAIEVGIAHPGVVVPAALDGVPVVVRVIGEVDAQTPKP